MLWLLSKLLCLVRLHTGLGVRRSSSSVNTEHPRTSLGMRTGTQPVAEGMESIFLYSGINIYIRSEQQIDFPNSTEETQSNFNAKKKKKKPKMS